jgi:ankyrin repeat protein
LSCHRNSSLTITKHLVETLKINTRYINKNNETCLTIACRNNRSFEIIKYLIEDLQMDVNHVNNFGYTSLLYVCRKTDNIETIKYLIQCKANINYATSETNCLLDACYENKSLNVIKYLIEELKMDINYTNSNNDNCLRYSCLNNDNIEIIKYLIEECKMDAFFVNKNGCDCLKLACSNNSVEIVKYLIEEQKTRIDNVSADQNDCLALACIYNNSIEVIEYLVNTHKMNMYKITNDKNNLYLACEKNTLGVIKHLIEKYFMNVLRDGSINKYFSKATGTNSNIDALKYLYELYMTNEHNCKNLHITFNDSTDLGIKKFLIEETNIPINTMTKEQYEKTIPFIKKNSNRLNELISFGLVNNYENDILKQINPFYLSLENRKNAKLISPYEYKYREFKNLVDKFPYTIPLEQNKPIEVKNSVDTTTTTTTTISKKHNDNESENELLFKYDNEYYYGNRTIVYNSIIILKEIKDVANFNEVITLNDSSCSPLAPKYFMDMWVNAAQTGHFDIMKIKTNDLQLCLKHIDQYPMGTLSLESLEYDIIKYFETYSCHIDKYINDMVEKYQMKLFYVFIHNYNI